MTALSLKTKQRIFHYFICYLHCTVLYEMCISCKFERQETFKKLNSRNKAIYLEQQLSAPCIYDLFKKSYI